MKDYYAILGVTRNASEAEIKKAFRRLAVMYHPDKNPAPGAAARFQEINEAYRVLGNVAKRRRYDTLMADPAAWFEPVPPRPVHRDPAYRRPGRPPGPPEPPLSFLLMQRYLPAMMWISRVGLAYLLVFAVDYFLPYRTAEDRMVELYVGRHGAYCDVVTENGREFRLYEPNVPVRIPDGRMHLWLTPVLGSLIWVENTDGSFQEYVARMYTTYIFFPLLLLIACVLAFLYRKEVEFCFNVNLAALILLMMNLLLI